MKPLKDEFIAMLRDLAQRPGATSAIQSLPDALALSDPDVAIRLNPRKHLSLTHLTDNVPWALNGRYLPPPRPHFTFDPALHQGRYYVQDPSSMAIYHIVSQFVKQPVLYIDACAAPGGKTTAAIDALPDGSIVIANEYDRRRADILVENIAKWGYPNTLVSNDDTARIASLGPVADIVAVDAPCSGEGMMRKDLDAVNQWSESLVNDCANLQWSIISNCWQALKPGGLFIYSTCTFNHSENEDNIARMVSRLGAIPVPTGLTTFPGVCDPVDSPYPAARFLPGAIRGEGLFIALLRKPLDHTPLQTIKPLKVKPLNNPALQSWIKPGYILTQLHADHITALPADNAPIINAIARQLNTLYIATPVATLRGRDYIPTQSLSLSQILNPQAFTSCPVTYTQAIDYLRGLTITLPPDTPRGIILLTYDNQPLAFAKNLGTRANNLYPKPWLIRTTHLPSPLILP